MKQAQTMEKMGYGNGTVPHNRKKRIGEWNLGMEWSRTLENMEIWEWNGPEQLNVWKFGNETVPHNEKYGNLGMERSRTMKKMGYGNETSPNNGKSGIREWNGPPQ